MDSLTTSLDEILRRNVADMAGETLTAKGQSRLYYVENTKEEVYAVIAPHDSDQEKAELVVMAHIVADKIVIDFDKVIPNLYERLVNAGVPEEQITFAGKKST